MTCGWLGACDRSQSRERSERPLSYPPDLRMCGGLLNFAPHSRYDLVLTKVRLPTRSRFLQPHRWPGSPTVPGEFTIVS
jgi:hypothetical protein